MNALVRNWNRRSQPGGVKLKPGFALHQVKSKKFPTLTRHIAHLPCWRRINSRTLEAPEAAGRGGHMVFLTVKGRDGIRTIQCISKSSKAKQVSFNKYFLAPTVCKTETLTQ